MRIGSVLIVVIALSGIGVGAWVRAESGGPPTIGPLAKPTPTTPAGAGGAKANYLDGQDIAALTISAQLCPAALAQASEEIEWWRTQVPPPAPAVVPGKPPLIGPIAAPRLPTASTLVASADSAPVNVAPGDVSTTGTVLD